MAFNDFKRLKPVETKISNPYSTANKTESNLSKKEDSDVMKASMLDGQNKHLYSLINILQKEMKELREDIASLYSIIEEPEIAEILTREENRERYMSFKRDPRHLINRTEKE